MKKVIRNIRYFVPILFKVNPFYFFIVVFNAIFQSAVTLANVYFSKDIIEVLVNDRTKEGLIRIIVFYIALFFILQVLIRILRSMQEYFTRKARHTLDDMFNKKVAEIDYFLFEDPIFNKEMDYAKEGMNNYTNGIYSFTLMLTNIISSVVSISGVIVIVIMFKNPIILAFFALSLVISFIVSTRYQNAGERYNKKWNETRLKHWYFIESIFNFPNHLSLRNYDAIDIIKDKNDKYSSIQLEDIKENAKSNLFTGFLGNINVYLFSGVVIVVLIISAFNGKITIPEFSMLFTSIFVLQGNFENLIYCTKQYLKDCDYLDNYINFMERETIYKDGKKEIDKITSVEFKNVYFKYPRCSDYVLEDVSFKIDLNKKISLVGVNGAGKTTIIKLIWRFFSPDKGEILINGININELDEHSLLKNLSIVFQDFKIISFMVKENIEIDKDNKEHLDDVLKKALIYDRIQELPKKEYTYVNKWFDKEGVVFSGGEMQKIAFARSLYKDGSLVVLDEPTSALDALSEAKIYHDFNAIVGQKPTLYISHRLSSCIFSDEIIVLDGKKIVQIGSHAELMKDKEGLYYQMFNAQAEYYSE